MSKQQRMAKKASKLLYKLYLGGINELSIKLDEEDIQLAVFIKPLRAVTAVKKVEL